MKQKESVEFWGPLYTMMPILSGSPLFNIYIDISEDDRGRQNTLFIAIQSPYYYRFLIGTSIRTCEDRRKNLIGPMCYNMR
jgi:hypothetical protein